MVGSLEKVLLLKKKILIVKCSSLGDILQSFIVAEYLRARHPDAKIDWLVEKSYEDLVAAHPKIDRAIGVRLKGGFSTLLSLFRQILFLRKKKYDWIFDLQGNCKSVFFTFFAKGKKKIGFGAKSVREWPNLFVTHIHFDPDLTKHMSLQYLEIAQRFLKDSQPFSAEGILLRLSKNRESRYCEDLVKQNASFRVLVSPSSRWENKKLSPSLWKFFLEKISCEKDSFFYFIWGNEAEKEEVQKLSSSFPQSMIVEKLSLPALQVLMSGVDLLLAVDSCVLHLGATLPHLATFSFFGPTRHEIFKPPGGRHLAFQGQCPYMHVFQKCCPHLRTCREGSCLKKVSPQEMEEAFSLCKTLFSSKELAGK